MPVIASNPTPKRRSIVTSCAEGRKVTFKLESNMQFIWWRTLLFLAFLCTPMCRRLHIRSNTPPRDTVLVLAAPPMNGRRTSLADATADPARLLEAYIPGLRRFAQ